MTELFCAVICVLWSNMCCFEGTTGLQRGDRAYVVELPTEHHLLWSQGASSDSICRHFSCCSSASSAADWPTHQSRVELLRCSRQSGRDRMCTCFKKGSFQWKCVGVGGTGEENGMPSDWWGKETLGALKLKKWHLVWGDVFLSHRLVELKEYQ